MEQNSGGVAPHLETNRHPAAGDEHGDAETPRDETHEGSVDEALSASEQRYRTLFEQAPVGVFVYDRGLHILECNAKFVSILQSTHEALIGLDMRTLRDQRVVPAIVHALDGAPTLYAGPYQATTSSARLWISMRMSPLRGRNGEVVGGMGLVEDITEQKGHQEALRRSEARFRGVVELSPDPVGVIRDGKLLYVNPACVRHWGYASASELVGRPVADLVHPDDADVVRARLAIGEVGVARSPHEYRMIRKDGSIVHDEVASIVIDYDGAPALLSIGRDVTDRKLMQARLVQADRMASVGTLAAGVAHEINNPLAYVMANLEIVAHRTIPDLAKRIGELEAELGEARGEASPPRDVSTRLARLTEVIEIARDGTERVRHTVRDLKAFSRSEEDLRTRIDVRRVLDASINIAWNEIRHRAQLVREYADVPPVWANESRLGQVFLNLLVNAAQALPVGMATANTIRVRAFCEAPDRVIVEVRDTGPGIARDQMHRLFEPFFTTKPVGVGTGLGLWICEGIVGALGGTIRASSDPGGETTFRVDLPSCVAGSIPPPQPSRAELQPSARRGRVLVVDDEAALAHVLASAIGSEHDVVVATSGREARDLLTRDPHFDVILCDLMMPDVSGMDLYAELGVRLPELLRRIVFVTGGAFTTRARELLAAVPNERVEKPFDMDKLRDLLRAHVDAR